MNLGHLALLVLLPLLQIPAVLYLSRYFEVDDSVRPASEFQIDRPETRIPDGACRRCGTVNDPAYTYCRRCVTNLPS